MKQHINLANQAKMRAFNETELRKIIEEFIKEQINIDSEEYVTTIQDCLSWNEELFNVIISRDIEVIKKYVDAI